MTINNKKGFTLIELLVVIAIIGILSSVVLASLNSARQKSRDARRVSDMKQLQLALELYFDTNRAYPVQTTQGALPASLVTGGHMAALPVEPVSSNAAYQYISAAGGSSYCLGAQIEGTPPTPADTCPVLNITTAGINYWVGP